MLNLTIAANSKNQSLRIGAILPLTGDYQELGNKILKTFELTIFELSNVDVTLIPFDNNSTEAGTRFAFKELQTQRVDIVLGPIFMKNLLSITQEENFSKYIFISLSNNNVGLPSNVITFGINLDSQILALSSTINDKNKKNIFADNSEFSMNVLKRIEEIKIPLSSKYQYSNFDEISEKAKMATSYNYRHKKLLNLIAELKKSDNSNDQAKVKSLEKRIHWEVWAINKL